MQLFTHIRLAHCFSNRRLRLLCVQARLQALSVLVYSNALAENAHALLYSGILEELVELLEMPSSNLVEIRAAALRTLTSIIHLDRNPHFPKWVMCVLCSGCQCFCCDAEMMINRTSWVVVLTLSYFLQKACVIVIFCTGYCWKPSTNSLTSLPAHGLIDCGLCYISTFYIVWLLFYYFMYRNTIQWVFLFHTIIVIVVASSHINLWLVRVKLDLDGEVLNFGSFSLKVI